MNSWNLAIAKGEDAVLPIGHPWSHSTHSTFSRPPAGITPMAGSESCPRRWPGLLDPFQSVALGVGICRTNPARPFLGFVASMFPVFFASFARGVGMARRFFRAFLELLPPSNPRVFGVWNDEIPSGAKNPYSVPLVRRPAVGSG